MNSMQSAARILIRLAQHPVTQAIARYAIRQATAELVRYIRQGTSRSKVPKSF